MLKASAQEVMQAYLEAVARNDQNVVFWRDTLLEKMRLLDAAIRNSEGVAGVNGDDPKGSRHSL